MFSTSAFTHEDEAKHEFDDDDEGDDEEHEEVIYRHGRLLCQLCLFVGGL